MSTSLITFIPLGSGLFEFFAQTLDRTVYVQSFITYCLVGAIVGGAANKFSSRNARMGLWPNIIVGILGALIGGYLLDPWIVPFYGYTGSRYAIQSFLGPLSGIVGATIGAVSLLLIAALVWPQSAKSVPKPDLESQPSIPPKASAEKVPSGPIFLSYRRADSADVAGRIYDRLLEAFDRVSVFKDVDSIPLGTDFKQYLGEKVGECNVLLAVIGDKWLDASDANGKRRLENPQDFVRIEIESALVRNIPVIPLLVRGASMPPEDELPDGLKKLAYRNGTQIRSDPDFHRDMDRVISALKTYGTSKR